MATRIDTISTKTIGAQIAEWDEPDSDLEDDSDILHLDDDGDLETVGDKDSWAGALLRTSVGSFLHGLTGRKVKKAPWVVVNR